jgi:DNA (cytosine-5)-methyltransferase 1
LRSQPTLRAALLLSGGEVVAYYNENDPFAAQWLRELIADGVICGGDVDDRSIEDVRPSDLSGYTQCHFFAGIGVWSLALRQAGWPDDRPIFTGSCPCQPFSAAGKGGGFADERHLWPAVFHLIAERAPDVVVGEQVASKDGLAWLDLVSSDLEAASYAIAAVDTCAAGFGAPHIRQRLYFGAKRVGQSDSSGRPARRQGGEADRYRSAVITGSSHVRMADTSVNGFQRSAIKTVFGTWRREEGNAAGCSRIPLDDPRRPGPTNGLWRNADWLFCRDGKWRPAEPGTFPLVDAGTFRNRVAELRGAGNAINLAQATQFIIAAREAINGGS